MQSRHNLLEGGAECGEVNRVDRLQDAADFLDSRISQLIVNIFHVLTSILPELQLRHRCRMTVLVEEAERRFLEHFVDLKGPLDDDAFERILHFHIACRRVTVTDFFLLCFELVNKFSHVDGNV